MSGTGSVEAVGHNKATLSGFKDRLGSIVWKVVRTALEHL